MKILLIGPQGSGKSTQGKLLADDLKIPYISTGDIFRELAGQDSEDSRRVKQTLTSGHLIDDETTAQIVKKRLQQDDTQNGFILDGYPRTKKQIELFDPGFDKVIYLDLSHNEAIVRLMQRGRSDDTKESIEQRLKLYRELTQEVVGYYAKPNVFKNIKAHLSIEEIQKEIREALKNG